MGRRDTLWDQYKLTESGLYLSDVTTNDVSTARHGFVPKAPSDATKYLDGTGAWSTPTGTASGYSMREEHLASNSSSLDFTSWYSSSYEEYEVSIFDMITASNTELTIQVSVNGGSSYLNTNEYEYWQNYSYVSGVGGTGAAGATRVSARPGANTTLAANTGYAWRLRLLNPAGSLHKLFFSHSVVVDNTAQLINATFGGRFKTTSAINAIRVIALSGNITSGTARIYGIAKA